MGLPQIMSTCSTVKPPATMCRKIEQMPKVPMRFAMNAGVSLHATTLLPRRTSAKARTVSTASGRVAGPATTSSSRM